MTEADFIKTLSASEQRVIKDVRHRLAGNMIKAAILLDGKVVPTDILVAGLWCIHHGKDAVVGLDKIGRVVVSTVFMTQPHLGGHFETMVGDSTEGRYRTLEEARAGHQRVCRRIHEDQRDR